MNKNTIILRKCLAPRNLMILKRQRTIFHDGIDGNSFLLGKLFFYLKNNQLIFKINGETIFFLETNSFWPLKTKNRR